MIEFSIKRFIIFIIGITTFLVGVRSYDFIGLNLKNGVTITFGLIILYLNPVLIELNQNKEVSNGYK